MSGSGKQSAAGRTAPWVGLLLATLCVGVTLQAGRVSGPPVTTAQDRLAEASFYLEEHPYLEPAEALRAYVDWERILELRRADERERAGEPVLDALVRHQQEKLDALVAESVEALGALPARRYGAGGVRADASGEAPWRPLSWLSHVLLHGSSVYLAGGVGLLLLLAFHLEPVLGSLRLLVVALFATLGAGATWTLAGASPTHVWLGSAGLLAGLLPVFAWDLRGSRDELSYRAILAGGALFLWVPPWLGIAWPLSHPGVELLGPMPSPHAIHLPLLGGLVGGCVGRAMLRLLGGRERDQRVSHRSGTSTGSATLDQALADRAAGREEVAFQKLTVLLHREPEQLDAALLLADVARGLGRHSAADAAMLRAIRLEAKRDETAAAVRHWLDLCVREIPREADPALLIRMASLLRHHDHPRAACDCLRKALEKATGSNTATVATRVARAAQELDARIAHDAAWRALGCAELTLEERQNLEDLLATVLPKLPGAELMISNAWSDDASRPASIEVETHTRVLDLVNAVPVSIDDEGIHIQTKKGSKKRVLYDRIDAVAVAAVEGFSEKPVLVVDVILNWNETEETGLRVIRLRGDRFDPRRLAPAETPLEAFRVLVGTILDRASATPLPDRDSALGNPFAAFEARSLYERTVLSAESPLTLDDD